MRERVEAQLGRSLEELQPGRRRLPARQPPRHPAAARAGALLDRRADPPRPDLGRPADRDRRSRRGGRSRHPDRPPAEPDPGRRARRGRGQVAAQLAAIGFPLDANPRVGQRDRLHRRAALQLLGHRDEDAPRPARRRPRGALRQRASPTCACTSTAARTRAPSTGSATSASRARPPATRTARGGRPTTSSSAAGSAPVPRSASRCSGAFPTEELDAAVAGLVDGWVQGRLPGESFSEFSRRLDDDELGALAGLEPARARQREEAA